MIAVSVTRRLVRLEEGQAVQAAAACCEAWETLCATIEVAEITPEGWAANDAALNEDQERFGQLLTALLRVLYDPKAKQDDIRRALEILAPYMELPAPSAWMILKAATAHFGEESERLQRWLDAGRST